MTTSDIDEVRHRIVVGVSDESLIGKATQRISGLGLPSNLIDVEVVPAPSLDALLTDFVRPLPGGMSISTTGGCTLGFNLIRYVGAPGDTAATERYFVTNSHCTATRGHVDGTTAFQGGSFIGTEVGDPDLFSHAQNSLCPVGYTCRFTDAALFEYDDPTDANQGYVAFPALNSLSFSTYLTVTSVQSPTAGYGVNMIGSTSGRKSGTVLAVCVDVWGITGWAGGRLLCQGKGSYAASGGDSGAPVVTAFGDGTSWATGIHWGHNSTNAWFSSMDAVINEFLTGVSGSPYVSPVVYP